MDCPEGSGIIRRIGWDKDDEGHAVFRAIIDFPNGPPTLECRVVFRAMPVTISETKP